VVPLKRVLHGKLHDPRPDVIKNLAECGSVLLTCRNRARIVRTVGQEVRMVRKVERFSAKIHSLPLTQSNRPREREIHIEEPRADERERLHIARNAIRYWRGKRGAVQPAVDRLMLAIRIRQDLRRAISSNAIQVGIDSRRGAERNSGMHAADNRKLPVARNRSQRPLRERRSLKHSRQIENVPQVRAGALSAIGSPIVRIRVRPRQQRRAEIGDAMRPCVIGLNREVVRQAVLQRE